MKITNKNDISESMYRNLVRFSKITRQRSIFLAAASGRPLLAPPFGIRAVVAGAGRTGPPVRGGWLRGVGSSGGGRRPRMVDEPIDLVKVKCDSTDDLADEEQPRDLSCKRRHAADEPRDLSLKSAAAARGSEPQTAPLDFSARALAPPPPLFFDLRTKLWQLGAATGPLALPWSNESSVSRRSEQKGSTGSASEGGKSQESSSQALERKKPHIKKPLNAFMLYMKEMRAKVVAECTLKESAAINQILGRRWHGLSRDEQAKYYEKARQERQLHMQLYPGWSARDNYGYGTKKKKRKKEKTVDGGNNMKKCRARYGLEQQSQWCKPCRRKKKCIRYMDLSGKGGEPADSEVSDMSSDNEDDTMDVGNRSSSCGGGSPNGLSSPGGLSLGSMASPLMVMPSPSTSLASPSMSLQSPMTPTTHHLPSEVVGAPRGRGRDYCRPAEPS
ncbi:Hypothetical predicted protein [Cloeon dipterum]|uniref:dTCF n=1 Tax=Cloeon dipterum TaxID=197152 RepID=A0A8S1DIL8_9INSE|nr:Hypothetical predicted protein [Cloeon dipterum]